MLRYSQTSGQFTDDDGAVVATGFYAGRDAGKNNPEMQTVHDVGPLPQGQYTICPPGPNPHVGQYALALIPATSNEMFGRSAFYIHGDNEAHVGESSDGCVVGSRAAREAVWTYVVRNGNQLTVTA